MPVFGDTPCPTTPAPTLLLMRQPRLSSLLTKASVRMPQVILKGCGARLMRFIRHIAYQQANDEDAEEILMDAIWAFITKPLPPHCNAAAWLFTLCRNCLI